VSDKRLTDSELTALDYESSDASGMAGIPNFNHVRRLIAEVREHRTRTAPAGLTQEEREAIGFARNMAYSGAWNDDQWRWVRVLDRLLASTAPAPADIATQLHALLIQKRADLAWAYQAVTAARASRYHAGADVTRDDEVRETLATLESLATAPGAIDQSAPAPAGGPPLSDDAGGPPLSDDGRTLDDITRTMAEMDVADAFDHGYHEAANLVRERMGLGFVASKHVTYTEAIATPATAEREG
jgi:hypothetical protein